MPRSLEALLRKLRAESATERLEAARFFAEHATPAEEQALREAASRESVAWIKSALRRALARISPDTQPLEGSGSIDTDELPKGFAAQIYAEALETTAAQLLHEVEPILGSLRLSAESEIANFEQSYTKQNLDRLDEFLSALGRLRRAASAPKMEEFSLDEVVGRCIDGLARPEALQVLRAGPIQCVVEGDSSLISLCVSNGLRNAVEATTAAGAPLDQVPITVSWGSTDIDYWVSIVDQGIGFKGVLQKAFDIGSTTKEGHLGMGLAIVFQSMASMSGKATLVPNERGVRFEVRWPKSAS
ncbi:MAG: HAMP domain-containing sensor histidine kinase [Xanthobacteraceae bacterium]